MARNTFETNDRDPELTEKELKQLGDKIHMILPALSEGYHYNFTKLSDGGVAITVEEETKRVEGKIDFSLFEQ
uniref:Uncharacterized protein n=1 Tax=Streptomyces phage Scarif TaxID=3158858 RepID=A0AAU7GX80_9CAUD